MDGEIVGEDSDGERDPEYSSYTRLASTDPHKPKRLLLLVLVI